MNKESKSKVVGKSAPANVKTKSKTQLEMTHLQTDMYRIANTLFKTWNDMPLFIFMDN